MPTSRRNFVRYSVTLALGACTTPIWLTDDAHAQGADCILPGVGEAQRLEPDEPRVLPRLSAAEMSNASAASALANFRAAVQAVRNRPANDVIGWQKLVAQHCIHCAPTNPSNIHFNWYFLPWHRALLYIVERNLRAVGPNDTLRLPYWDWEHAQRRTLPEIYRPSGQSLFWDRRRLTGPAWPLSDEAVNVRPLLSIPTFDDFGGTATTRAPVPATFTGPHAEVHNAFAPGDMADLRFSPRDPVFYAHHANLDRLWSSWTSPDHQNPDFGTARVNFFDEQRRWRYILLNDLKDEARLGYRYSRLMQPVVPFSMLRSFSLRRDDAGRYAASDAPAADQLRSAGPHYLLLRNVEGLEKFPADTLRYGIFSGTPEVGTDAARDVEYLGRLSRVVSTGHEGAGPLSGALDVSDKLARVVTANNNVVPLTVAPLDMNNKTTAQGIPLVAKGVTVVT